MNKCLLSGAHQEGAKDVEKTILFSIFECTWSRHSSSAEQARICDNLL